MPYLHELIAWHIFLFTFNLLEIDMAIAKSNTNDLASLFKEGCFRIPSYQRRYSWEKKQQLELFDDLLEAFKTKTKHFLGTLSLQLIDTKGFKSCYNIIDGQQRFTTLLLLYTCLAKMSDDSQYLDHLNKNEEFFLEPINKEEKDFLINLLNQKNPKPLTLSQENMVEAIKEYTKQVKRIRAEDINDFLDHILNNTIFLIYLVDDYAASIKMFESVNDRGMPLKYFDKMKSFILYFSEKYLSREIDDVINTTFNLIYSFFDNKELTLDINNDETLLLYHYLSNPSLFTNWAYAKSTNNIFLDFEKKLQEKLSYKEFFCLLKPYQRMFPLSIRFNHIGILDDTIGLLEKIEFFLKSRRNPIKDTFKLLEHVIVSGETKEDVIRYVNNELYYISKWQYNAIDIVNTIPEAAKYSLYLFNKHHCKQIVEPDIYKDLELEHIFPQEPSFPIQNYGYDEESYSYMLNNIGNLTLLEGPINSSASNKPPEDKIREYYINSEIIMTQEITIKNIDDVKNRTEKFELFLNNHFAFELK
jgi:uncharacterized protein with ParB-like and HNH nuclease domain